MAEPFKNLIDDALVRRTGAHLHRTWPRFDRRGFEQQALAGLDALELKARAMQIATALEATLPTDFGHAAAVIEDALAPPADPDAPVNSARHDQGLAGWVVWSLGEFVVRRGQHDVPRALAALHALTQRFSAEFAIRPFIAAHPRMVFDTLARWVRDPSAHVRRLVSEGTRPRLPWGLRLHGLVADPTPSLPLLASLQDDTSPYVRRSVANHLNDIAKDHPQLLRGWLHQHLPQAPAERRALLRHASRTLVKQGDDEVLRAWGLGAAFEGTLRLALSPARLRVGETLDLAVQLQSRARVPQKLAIDYVVHHVKADGRRTPKVFKGWVIELAPGERRELHKRHSMREVTTRRYHPGGHAVGLRVNGADLAVAPFELLPA